MCSFLSLIVSNFILPSRHPHCVAENAYVDRHPSWHPSVRQVPSAPTGHRAIDPGLFSRVFPCNVLTLKPVGHWALKLRCQRNLWNFILRKQNYKILKLAESFQVQSCQQSDEPKPFTEGYCTGQHSEQSHYRPESVAWTSQSSSQKHRTMVYSRI